LRRKQALESVRQKFEAKRRVRLDRAVKNAIQEMQKSLIYMLNESDRLNTYDL
jgi:hypothetical protein